MNRLIENTVFSGFVMACRRATWPTRISPSLAKATTEGVKRLPSWLGMTWGSPPSITATTELVVPRSIPITLAMVVPSSQVLTGIRRVPVAAAVFGNRTVSTPRLTRASA